MITPPGKKKTVPPRGVRRFPMCGKTATLLLALAALAPPIRAQQYTIKFATVAPEGSPWMNVMREFDRQIRAESGGRLVTREEIEERLWGKDVFVMQSTE